HYAVSTVIDVRSHPHSLANPHFNKEVLEYELPRSSIQYLWMGEGLGGSDLRRRTIRQTLRGG
ncbi:MAG: DUF488 family protein, partial [Halobacteriota archaeon]